MKCLSNSIWNFLVAKLGGLFLHLSVTDNHVTQSFGPDVWVWTVFEGLLSEKCAQLSPFVRFRLQRHAKKLCDGVSGRLRHHFRRGWTTQTSSFEAYWSLNVNVWVCVCSYRDTAVPSAVGSIVAAGSSLHISADIHSAPSPCRQSAPHNCSTQWTWGEEVAAFMTHS